MYFTIQISEHIDTPQPALPPSCQYSSGTILLPCLFLFSFFFFLIETYLQFIIRLRTLLRQSSRSSKQKKTLFLESTKSASDNQIPKCPSVQVTFLYCVLVTQLRETMLCVFWELVSFTKHDDFQSHLFYCKRKDLIFFMFFRSLHIPYFLYSVITDGHLD